MRRFDAPILLVATLASLVLLATPLLAQEPAQQPPPPKAEPPSLEAFLGVTFAFPDMSGVWTRTITEPSHSWGGWTYPGWRTDATLGFSTTSAVGIDVGANIFFNRRLGLQIILDHFGSEFVGPPGVFNYRDDTGKTSTTESEGAHGNARWLGVSLNAVVRGQLPRRWAWTLSGGLSVFSLDAEVGSIPCDTVIGRCLRRGMMYAHILQLGGNAGASLTVPVVRRLAVFADARYFATGGILLDGAPTGAAPLDPSYFRLMVGVNCLLWRKPGADIVDGWKAR
jgi:hypothetical protein